MARSSSLFDRFGREAAPSWVPVVRECVDYVPVIEAPDGFGAGLLCSADGLVLTNAHVAGHDDLNVVFKDHTRVNALPVYEHSSLDLTLVRAAVQTRGYFDLPNRLAAEYEAGQEVLAIGHPRGHTHTASRGIISHDHRLMRDQAFVQTDVAINPGNSGGPLLDVQGHLVGINTETVADSQGLSLAIPVDAVFAFWNDFVYEQGRLGTRIATETEIRSRTLPREPGEIVQAAASLADVATEQAEGGRDGSYWATTRTGHVYHAYADRSYFMLTHVFGKYRGNNPDLTLQLLRWQREFHYVKFEMDGSILRLGCWRDFEDLDVSEAARSMTEMERAIDHYADQLRPYIED